MNTLIWSQNRYYFNWCVKQKNSSGGRGKVKTILLYIDRITEIWKTIEWLKIVVEYFNQSNLQHKIPVTLKYENYTKWSSLYKYLKSVLTLFDKALKSVFKIKQGKGAPIEITE